MAVRSHIVWQWEATLYGNEKSSAIHYLSEIDVFLYHLVICTRVGLTNVFLDTERKGVDILYCTLMIISIRKLHCKSATVHSDHCTLHELSPLYAWLVTYIIREFVRWCSYELTILHEWPPAGSPALEEAWQKRHRIPHKLHIGRCVMYMYMYLLWECWGTSSKPTFLSWCVAVGQRSSAANAHFSAPITTTRENCDTHTSNSLQEMWRKYNVHVHTYSLMQQLSHSHHMTLAFLLPTLPLPPWCSLTWSGSDTECSSWGATLLPLPTDHHSTHQCNFFLKRTWRYALRIHMLRTYMYSAETIHGWVRWKGGR